MPTVLIVDDNADLREILSELLRIKGFDVLLAHDGEHAWDVLQEEHPDIVLSDIDMPRLDGISLCHRIREASRTSTIPLVLLSGKPPAICPTVVFDVIRKPVHLEELLSTLTRALGSANANN